MRLVAHPPRLAWLSPLLIYVSLPAPIHFTSPPWLTSRHPSKSLLSFFPSPQSLPGESFHPMTLTVTSTYMMPESVETVLTQTSSCCFQLPSGIYFTHSSNWICPDALSLCPHPSSAFLFLTQLLSPPPCKPWVWKRINLADLRPPTLESFAYEIDHWLAPGDLASKRSLHWSKAFPKWPWLLCLTCLYTTMWFMLNVCFSSESLEFW